MALTPDFDSYPIDVTLSAVAVHPRWIEVVWADGRISRFHHIWLRDNCPCDVCVHPITKEQMFELVTVPLDLQPASADIDAQGSLEVAWDDGHHSQFHAGWLRANCYSVWARADRGRNVVTWDAATFSEPPTFDGAAVMTDDDALYDWLVALSTFGISRVRNLPCETDTVAELVSRIGIVRETNFGVLWDVKSEANPISNANTALPLPPHVDLATREYQPGLQFLHCLVNDTEGGDNILLDGFRIGELLRDDEPEAFRVLSTIPWTWANRSVGSDYRWTSPMFVTNPDGSFKEVRVGNWLRAPLDLPFDEIEQAYSAYRTLFDMTYRSDLQVRFRLEAGDAMVFDNRRALHARSEFTDMSGRRHLRGAYSERDELSSRLAMLERGRRARRVAHLADGVAASAAR